MTQLFAVLLLAVVLGIIVAAVLVAAQTRRGRMNVRLPVLAFLVVLVAILSLAALSDTVVQIEAGTVGVVKRFGNIVGVFNPGLNFKLPFVDQVVIYRTQEIVYETSENPAESRADYRDYEVDTATADGSRFEPGTQFAFAFVRSGRRTFCATWEPRPRWWKRL